MQLRLSESRCRICAFYLEEVWRVSITFRCYFKHVHKYSYKWPSLTITAKKASDKQMSGQCECLISLRSSCMQPPWLSSREEQQLKKWRCVRVTFASEIEQENWKLCGLFFFLPSDNPCSWCQEIVAVNRRWFHHTGALNKVIARVNALIMPL